ncbi:ABC-type transport system involved in multi-copper enzyme maturation, permease component [Methanocella conradii HZ254]|uniref:ABC-type transport system involved in multi-copper enzyme maturation, permease component n=1 Tax=Methanocella conradii (strain DSM 24694 / JCM 17849 / CGMCC 1.5162 / HZ254) TaxID=1041930 RepID=H8I8J8_METCZ|nr:ABC transporter permease subunit [Methanocella conradii]AFC99474.1 ABC-type transport system involved in multi-copper enzyme maturation, permease component [Methanocella conradii HZ254]
MYINNVLIIAKKEFSDLLSNWMMLLVLAVYLIIILVNVFNINNMLVADNAPIIHELFGDSYGAYFASCLFWDLTKFGSIVGVMIGCLSMANERHNNALNTLLVKPLFRDTIINGKLLGSIAFMAFIIGVTLVFDTSALFLFCGNYLAPFLSDYVSRLIIVFLFAIIYVMFFLALSMLISILVKSQAFAMILGLMALYISEMMNVYEFAWNLSSLFPGDRGYTTNLILSLSPDTMLWSLYLTIFKPSLDFFSALALAIPSIEELSLFIAVACISSYIVFTRRDVT